MTDSKPLVFRFEDFEVREREFLISRAGEALPVEPKAFRVLLVLLRNPRRLVTKEELLDAVWNDCNVSENSLARSVARLRNTLGDDPREPRYIATVPTVGYRFVCDVERTGEGEATSVVVDEMAVDELAVNEPAVDARKGEAQTSNVENETGYKADSHRGRLRMASWGLLSLAAVTLAAGLLYTIWRQRPVPAVQRTLTRLTYYDGLQIDATWSPDGRFFAYSADRGGKFDVWIQQASGGDPVQVTHGLGHNWQPEWSPDGRYIAYRSEAGEGGIFAVPALGGAGQRIKLSSFGYYPHWSPDGQRVLFQTAIFAGNNRLYVAPLSGEGPHEVLADFVTQQSGDVISANWHPDGKRISVWLWQSLAGLNLFTLPIEGGPALETRIPAETIRRLGNPPQDEYADDSRFSWARSGDAVYFEQTLGGAKNIWKLNVDPATLEGAALERLTAGQGPDFGPVVGPGKAPDGQQVLYTAGSRKVQVWVYPLDANGGRVLGEGTPIVSAGMDGWQSALTRDGNQLIVDMQRGGKEQLWRKILPTGEEGPLMSDGFIRAYPEWSPDGRQLVYNRLKPAGPSAATTPSQLMVWSSEDGEERPVTDLADEPVAVMDWSADGSTLLVSKGNTGDKRTTTWSVWSMTVSAAPHAERNARRLISDPAYEIFQAHYSPDGRWIVFEAIKTHASGDESVIYVSSVTGGPWTRLTDGKNWADKPRWSPDGKLVYFVSSRGGFFNVWATHFDPVHGLPVGQAFPVTHFDNPKLMIPTSISPVAISIGKGRLALTVSQVSGGIWVIGEGGR